MEVDGPVHFATNSRHLMGGTALKRRLLQVTTQCAESVAYSKAVCYGVTATGVP